MFLFSKCGHGFPFYFFFPWYYSLISLHSLQLFCVRCSHCSSATKQVATGPWLEALGCTHCIHPSMSSFINLFHKINSIPSHPLKTLFKLLNPMVTSTHFTKLRTLFMEVKQFMEEIPEARTFPKLWR